MASITDSVLSELKQLVADYQNQIEGPAKYIDDLGEELRNSGGVLAVAPDDSEKTAPIVSIDGGNATENLAGGDLMVAGATAGEGLYSERVYKETDDVPSAVFLQFMPHRNENTKIASTVRSALELRVTAQVGSDSPEAYRVIDGAYLGNVSTVLFALLDATKNLNTAKHVLDLGFRDSDGLLSSAMHEILSPPKDGGKIFALVKNDSSSVYVQETLETTDLAGTTDRVLASRTLHPGEMFQPRALRANPVLLDLLKKRFSHPDFGKGLDDKTLLTTLVRGKRALMESLDVVETEEETTGGLWTTYFKPFSWSHNAKALRLEFPFTPAGGTVEERYASVVKQANKLVNVVNNDIVSEDVLEPWCQYEADRNAKEVSTAINLAKAALIDALPADEVVRSLLRSYRT